MTVSSTPRKVRFLGNDSATAFPFAFKLFATSDLALTLIEADGTETLLTLDSDYAIALNSDQDNDPGGEITYPLTGSPLTDGDVLAGIGTLAAEQGTDLTNLGRFLPQVIEDAFDRLTILVQQAKEKLDRALLVSAADAASPGSIPLATDRAGKFLAFDASGDPIATSGTGADGALREDLAEPTGTALIGHTDTEGVELPLDEFLDRLEGSADLAGQGLGFLAAKMAAGLPVKIAIYGDSTDDGNETTGWTANPTSGGDAVGAGAHNPPNAWAAKLQTLLRAMFGNNLIEVWNAGYSGQEMGDGWAYDNYDAAVINNPDYGVPDATILGFGLNDIDSAGSDFENHRTQLYRLARRILADGTMPIIRTCDPIARNLPASRDHKESSRQIDQVKFSVASALRLPILDMGAELRRAYAVNQDGRRWGIDQADSLHFGDAGHAMKAGIVAKHLFVDTVIVTEQTERVSVHDSRSSNIASYGGLTTIANVTPGSNINYVITVPTFTAMMTLWVWNEFANTELIYRGPANEDYQFDDLTNAPKVRVTEMVGGTAVSRTPQAVGFIDDDNSGNYPKSDLPYRVQHLPYGLSKVEYISGDSTTDLFYGHFEFRQTPLSRGRGGLPWTDGLSGRHFYQYTFAASGDQSVLFPEAEDFSNVYGLMENDFVDIRFDVTIPLGSGFVLGSTQTWATGTAYGDRIFAFFYRHTADKMRLYNAIRKADGTTTYSSSLGESAAGATFSSDRAKFRCRIRRTGNDQVITFYAGYTSTTAILTVTLARTGPGSIPFAGAVGGAFWNATAASGAGSVLIHEILIHRQ